MGRILLQRRRLVDEREHAARVHRLDQVGVEARLLAALAIVLLAVTGERDEPAAPAELIADAPRQLVAVHDRKADVEDGDVGRVILDRGQPIAPAQPPVHNDQLISGATQQLGQYLFTNQIVNLELAGVILTVAMVGAIVIARKRIVGSSVTPGATETVIGPATPVDDNPHSIPVTGTDNPRQKAYPQT